MKGISNKMPAVIYHNMNRREQRLGHPDDQETGGYQVLG